MKVCKQVKFVQGISLEDLQNQLNTYLLNGAEVVAMDIQSLTGGVIVTEYVGEIEKTALDELEDEFGHHTCQECPFFEESTDKRRKWQTCEKGKRVQKSSYCCTAYYETLREEVKSEVSENKGNDGLLRRESRGCGGMAQEIQPGGLRPIEWPKQIPTIGAGIPRGIPKHSGRRTIYGGRRC